MARVASSAGGARLFGGSPLPPQLELGLDARDQLARRERLDQVVVGARVQPFDARLVAGARRQHDRPERRQCASVRAQRAQQLEAVQPGHHHVGQDQVGRVALAPRPAPPDRRRPPSTAPAPLEDPPARSRACRRCRRPPGCARPLGVSPAVAARRRGAPPPRARRRAASAAPPRRKAPAPVDGRRRARARRRRAPRAGAALPRGIETVNVVPWPSAARRRDVAAVQPHQLVHQRQADARPFVRARARALARGGSVRTGAAAPARGSPTPVSATVSSTRSPRGRSVTAIDALERELERVREQVEDDPLPHVAVDERRARAQRPARDEQLDARALDRRRGSRWPDPWSARSRSVAWYEACARPASMRAKSSRVLTSFSRRSSLRWTVSSASPGQHAARREARPRSAPASASAACGTRG